MDIEPLIDAFGRRVRKLRVSVTDRCNLRCHYCMPSSPDWIPRPSDQAEFVRPSTGMFAIGG